ncbi:MAG: S-methyl-5'-thioadenosine phosphorylase [Pseudomonadota bacterium]
MEQQVIGVIGGSGVYGLEGLSNVQHIAVKTPFGDPSDEYLVGELEGRKLVFLARHARGHKFSPSELNFRANVHGFLQFGAKWVISISAVGSMREDFKPGHIVIVDQFFDRTKDRPCSFYGEGIVGHVQFADPVCLDLANVLFEAAEQVKAKVHKDGTYICIEGPQFSTRAESEIYRSWGVDVIGMTNLPEAKLAREAGICYATMAMVTDYDCWHEEEDDVSAGSIMQVLRENAAKAREVVAAAALRIPKKRTCGCLQAARSAVVTAKEDMDPTTRKKLALILGEEKGG